MQFVLLVMIFCHIADHLSALYSRSTLNAAPRVKKLSSVNPRFCPRVFTPRLFFVAWFVLVSLFFVTDMPTCHRRKSLRLKNNIEFHFGP